MALKAEAPEIAKSLNTNLQHQVPEFRQWFERFTAQQLDAGFDQLAALSAARFREYVRQHRQDFAAMLNEVAENPDALSDQVQKVEKELQDWVGADLEQQSFDALRLLRSLNERLDELTDNRNLTPEQLIERRILQLAKTILQHKVQKWTESKTD